MVDFPRLRDPRERRDFRYTKIIVIPAARAVNVAAEEFRPGVRGGGLP